MIWRIRERSAFQRIASQGRRIRAGVLWCTYLPDDTSTPPRVAFAIGRAQGSAVVRNRLRRRLRAMLAVSALPSGSYLFGVRPGAASRSRNELEFDLARLLAAVHGSLA